MTARLDQAAAELHRVAAANQVDLGSEDVSFVLGLLVAWVTRHEVEFADAARWVAELHWIAAVIATAGGNQLTEETVRHLYDTWDQYRQS